MSDTMGGPPAEPTVDGTAVLVAERLPSAASAARGRRKPARAPGERGWLAGIFLAPAGVLLLGLVLYPLVYSVVRSLFRDGPAGAIGSFAGLHNYVTVFTDSGTLRAVKNNLIWLVVTPTLVTIFGLIFAVLSERIRWATLFKTVLFVPMAISGLAVGVTFALIYSDQPSRGLANTVTVGIHNIFSQASGYPNEHMLNTTKFTGSATAGYTSKGTFAPGTPVLLPLVGLDLLKPPGGLSSAKPPSNGPGITGVVWNDFKLGGAGTPGKVDPGELGLKGITVQAVHGGNVVASATTDATGDFSFPSLTSGSYQIRLPAQDFSQPFSGYSWLGPNLITPAIIIAYLWVYAGFAMVLLAAGMAAIPRDALEAARIDGATEWQVFRRVTAPLLAPVLTVVFVTMVINVLKVFDVVFIISQSAGANGKYANVLAVDLFTDYGNQSYGLASAIGVVLVIVLIPAMIFNIRRFRSSQQ